MEAEELTGRSLRGDSPLLVRQAQPALRHTAATIHHVRPALCEALGNPGIMPIVMPVRIKGGLISAHVSQDKKSVSCPIGGIERSVLLAYAARRNRSRNSRKKSSTSFSARLLA